MSDQARQLELLRTSLAGRYEIERELGQGGMSTVYLARDLRHDRQVAIKLLRPELAAVVGAERFLQEIKITAHLQHAHILPLFDSGTAGSLLYYVMPFVEGESLRDRLNREKQLGLDEALRITEQVASALDYAHRHGVIHRDIKPENILLHEGDAFVADFGIAVALSLAGGERLTQTGLSLGTPEYMSPEQAAGQKHLTAQTDIYSLGCVVYEMLAGDPPHTASTVQAVIAKILNERPTRLSVLRQSVPLNVEQAVHRALERVPGDRPTSAADFRQALHATAPSIPLRDEKAGERSGWRRKPVAGVGIGVIAVALVVAVWWSRRASDRSEWARTTALPEIERLINADAFDSAYLVAREVEQVLPNDPRLDSLWPRIGGMTPIRSVPAGATVLWAPYDTSRPEWLSLGQTPIDSIRIPWRASRLRVELDGYRPLEFLGYPQRLAADLHLLPADTNGPDEVWVDGGQYSLNYQSPGLWHLPTLVLGDYLIDRHEVTNREFKEFVTRGGYQNREYWPYPFVKQGKPLSWDQAMAEFKDRTGRTGPSTWEVGDYPAGQADYPVTGVSWYEAAAYARFVGRELPTVYHWYRAAQTGAGTWLLPTSNLEGTKLAPVGQFTGWGPYGTVDMAGNAREWLYNAIGDQRVTAGGGWNDAHYMFALSNAQPALDRSPTNGFRLVRYVGDTTALPRARQPITSPTRDFAAEKPVGDAIFAIYKRLYAYDATPLRTSIESADTTDEWIRQRITFDAPYGSERVTLYLYLPKDRRPPFETVIYYPGSNAFSLRSFDQYATVHARFIVKSGRALAFPVYESTFERSDGFRYTLQDSTNTYRQHVIEWSQDLRRSLDYLETREDINAHRFAYFGFSWGGRMGVIMLALEPRLVTGVLYLAGFSPLPTQPSVDPFNFAPRITVPVLMLSGRYDHIYPLETAARPLFRTLGTAANQKRHVVSDGGHFIPTDQLIAETLSWLDRYQGPVR